MAEELTGNPQANQLLSDLIHKNYFIQKYIHHREAYQYHPLFREFLLTRAKNTFIPEYLSQIQHNAARILEMNDQAEDAVELFLKTEEWLDVKQLILQHAPSLIGQGRGKTLEEWINHLPEEMIESIPYLLYWKGICRLPYSPREARVCFEQAFHLFETQGDETGTYLTWSAVIESIHYEWDDFTSLDQWIDWLDRRMVHHPVFPSPEIEARVATSMTGALLLRFDGPRMKEWLKRALELCRKTMDMSLLFQNYVWAVVYYVMAGKIAEAGMMAEETKKMASTSAANPLNLIYWKFVEAIYLENTSETPYAAFQAIQEGLEIAGRNGVHIMDHMLFGHGVYSSLCLGDLAKAEEFVQKMGDILERGRRNIVSHYHFLLGCCHFLRGRISLAAFHVEKALNLVVETGMRISEYVCRLLMSRILHWKGEDEEALAQLATFEGIIKRFGCLVYEYQLQMTEAQFAMDQGDEERCVEALRQGLAFGKNLGLKTMLFIWQPSEMARLCAIALEKEIEVDYVLNLIRIFHLPPDNISPGIENWPYPLKIYTLGRFGLLRYGKPIQVSRKTKQRPLSMLKVLIALGGRDIREDQISDVLWPEANGDDAHHSFVTNLYRLRQLLGYENAIQLREGRLTLDNKFCWVDVWAFERLLGEADARRKEGLTESAVQLTEKAIELYKRPFLAGEIEQPFAISMRENLRSKFLRNVTWLGNHYEQLGQYEKAIENYRRGLEVDDIAEELYQHLMLCYQRLGRRAEAIAVYNRCRKILSVVLGIEPSPRTEAIYKSLLI